MDPRPRACPAGGGGSGRTGCPGTLPSVPRGPRRSHPQSPLLARPGLAVSVPLPGAVPVPILLTAAAESDAAPPRGRAGPAVTPAGPRPSPDGSWQVQMGPDPPQPRVTGPRCALASPEARAGDGRAAGRGLVRSLCPPAPRQREGLVLLTVGSQGSQGPATHRARPGTGGWHRGHRGSAGAARG